MPNGYKHDENKYAGKGYSEAEVEILLQLERLSARMDVFESNLKIVQRVVFGAVGIILTGVLVAVVGLVVI